MESSKQIFFEAVGRGAVDEIKSMVTVNSKELMVHLARSSNDLGETPLILAVKGNHEKMVELLIEDLGALVVQTGRFLWKGIDYQAVPPLFVAIFAEHTDPMPIIKFLIEKDLPENANSPAGLDSIVSSSVPITQKIDILELMAAAYILQKKFTSGMKYWMEALGLRQSTEDVGPLPQDFDEHFRRMMGGATEITSMEQLQDLATTLNPVAWNIQALLISRRILSRIDPDGFHLFFLRLCIQRIILCRELRQLTHMFDFSIFVLELFDALQLEVQLINLWPLLYDVFHCMFFFFNEKYPLPLGDPEREDLSIENILRAIRLGSVLIYKHQRLRLEGKLPPDPIAPADVPGTPPGSILSMIKTTHHMALYLYYLARDETYLLQVKQQLFQYNQFIKENPGVISLLHLAVIFVDSTALPIDQIQLLLETGADPNANDIHGNTPFICWP